MSTKIIKTCDRCGKNIAHIRVGERFTIREYINAFPLPPINDVEYDLCKDCETELKKWLNVRKEYTDNG